MPRDAGRLVESLLEQNILAGYPLGRAYPELPQYLLIAVTEKRTRQEMDALVAGLEGLA